MESAIPSGLRCPRLYPRRIEDDYRPPFAAWTAGDEREAEPLVMACFGVQATSDHAEAALSALHGIVASLFGADGATHYDLALFRDAAGYENYIVMAYWADSAVFKAWQASAGARLIVDVDQAKSQGLGFFREIFTPGRDRLETLYSSERLEGAGLALGELTGPVQEHGYWGAVRDRLAVAQRDRLASCGELTVELTDSGTLRVFGHENLAMIRSGQDWTATKGEERALYLEKVEPVLKAGMAYLGGKGREIGCYANRFATAIDPDGVPQERTFGLSYWRSLTDMERWSEVHGTHVRIFETFMAMVQRLEGNLDLRLYHEVSVLRSGQQFYEYCNCHPGTGLLAHFQKGENKAAGRAD